MTSVSYTVPVISADLRHEEMVQQMCDTLNYLDQVAADIFSRISQRVSENREQLGALNSRIAVAEAKVNRIKGSNKATRVFSSAKYPSAEKEPDYCSVFGNVAENLQCPQPTKYCIRTKRPPPSSQIIREKREYYHVGNKAREAGNDVGSQSEGLGRLPRNIHSVSSLLLFNTSENPYKKYVMLDPLGVVTKTRTSLDEDSSERPAAAPSTIQQHEELSQLSKESYSYIPGIGAVPELSLPECLPDLAGVAGDLMYSAELGPSIAPSVPGSNMPMPDLPVVMPEPDTSALPPSFAGKDRPTHEVPPPGPPPPGPPPPGPPPPGPPPAGMPPPPLPPPAAVPVNTPAVPASSAPPPAAPSVPTSTSTPADNSQATTTPLSTLPVDNSRASLLEDIRGFKKAKLTRASEQKVSKKKKHAGGEDVVDRPGRGASASGGGDLMSDLAAKLQLRRKGISGAGKTVPAAASGDSGADSDTGRQARNPLDRLSKLIPPPKPKPTDSSDNRDDDWA